MLVDNTKENRMVKRVAATMAIENMYVDKSFITKMMEISNGEKDVEEIIKEIRQEYVGQ